MMLKKHSLNTIEEEKRLTPMQKKAAGIITTCVLITFFGVLTWFVGRQMISLVSEPEKFRLWVDSHGLWSRFAFIGMMIIQVIFAVIPGEPLEIGAGYAFGAVEGTLLCVIGITLGSLLVFFLVRKFGVRLVEVFFSIEKIRSLKFLQNEKRLDAIIFLIFFIPGTPKDLLSYFAGLTDIKPLHWFIIVTIARLPSIITSTVGGNALGGQEYKFAVTVFAVTLIISVCGALIYNKISKIKSEKTNKK